MNRAAAPNYLARYSSADKLSMSIDPHAARFDGRSRGSNPHVHESCAPRLAPKLRTSRESTEPSSRPRWTYVNTKGTPESYSLCDRPLVNGAFRQILRDSFPQNK